jgi:segregation and condensation protein A
MNYTVSLPTFEGPLDLLLRLIERAELDITTIALAHVADQYLAHVRTLETVDPDGIADFVSIAARLLLIKSRALLPRPADPARDGGHADGDAEALAEQLREYQRYKQAAALLRAWHELDRRMFLRTAIAPLPPAVNTPAPLSHTVAELLAAVERRMQLRLPLDQPTVLALEPRRTVAQVALAIRERLQRMAWFSFEDLFDDVTSRQDVIVIFWAVLELLKRRVITIEQDALFGAISIGRGDHPDEQTPMSESEL